MAEPLSGGRRLPRVDVLLEDPRLAAAARRLGRARVKSALGTVLGDLRAGGPGPRDPEAVLTRVLAALPATATSLRPVINATGVVLHTNLGRAPLSAAAREALLVAAGATDVEFDLSTGTRGRRGRGTSAALAAAVPGAADVLVVNNGAAALVLTATALAAGREIVISRGEMVEIGDGFRLPDLLVSTGARLREVGTTNRVAVVDYEAAVGPDTGFVLKVHPSNFVVTGFTASVGVAALRGVGVPVVADIGSGLLAPHPALPDEPDAATTLQAGADLVIASADKLLGGPQAGLLLGRADLVQRLRRHPLARALRVDKLTLAALEATLTGPPTPTAHALAADPAQLRRRAEAIVDRVRAADVPAEAIDSRAAVGGGGAPGLELPSAAVALAPELAAALRVGDPAVLGRVEQGRCLLDLRAVGPDDDDALVRAIRAAAGR